MAKPVRWLKAVGNDFDAAFMMNIIRCYAEERLQNERYKEILNRKGKTVHNFDASPTTTRSESYLDLRHFALRKVVNPFNHIRFISLTLITLLDYTLRILASILITLSEVIFKTLFLAWWCNQNFLSKALVSLFTLPSMLCSWAFYASLNAARIIINHIFSPVNSFIRPLWNFFTDPTRSLPLKIFVALGILGLTAGSITAIILTGGGALLPLALLIPLAVFLTTPTAHAAFHILKDTLMSLMATVRYTFSHGESYTHIGGRYPSLTGNNDKLVYLNLSTAYDHQPKEGAITKIIFNSKKDVLIEPSEPRRFWRTAASFFPGLEPSETPRAGGLPASASESDHGSDNDQVLSY